tara:strand:+ start:61 stop:1023 length:963 start_codon:yes stop_codon:yes gene_type:complete
MRIKKKVVVTGCAGFIGSHLTELLIKLNYYVIGIDNLSTGKLKFLKHIRNNKNFKFYKLDLFQNNKLEKYFKSAQIIFHLSANADVRNGFKNPKKDLEQNTIVTFKILELARKLSIKKVVFSSTGSIYGEPKKFPTKENYNFPIQTSLYASSKLAGEGLMQAYAYGYNIKVYIFRFVSIFGKRYTHGHLYDFYKKLKKNPKKLEILGNGLQKKSYLNVSDCIDAIIIGLKKSKDKINIFNLGLNNFITVNQSINYICNYLKLKPKRIYTGGKRGWIGDSPKIFLDTQKIRRLGWKPKKNIEQSIYETLSFFKDNEWIFKK